MAKLTPTALFEVTDLYAANLKAARNPIIDVVVNQGGTSSGKTYSIMQVLFTLALANPKSVITVAGQDIPNLKKGALRDAQNIVADGELLKRYIKSYNKSDRVYELHNGSLIEFNSYDDFQDAKSGKRDYLFVNEGNGISLPIYNELALRTRKTVFIDYNPNAEFWVHSDVIPLPTTQLLISDHRHNTFLSQKMHDKIENINDPELWKVYARGQTGKIEGLVFRNWEEVDGIPSSAKFIGTGLDFGFTNDPTAVVDVFMGDGELYVDERVYETGLTNPDINNRMRDSGGNPRRRIVADSADPKSIKEISNLGWYIEGALKGPDSVNNSIDIIKRYKLNVTKRSYNLKKELKTYKWRQDKSGKTLNEPVDFMNHAIDALRYVGLNFLGSSITNGTYNMA